MTVPLPYKASLSEKSWCLLFLKRKLCSIKCAFDVIVKLHRINNKFKFFKQTVENLSCLKFKQTLL